MLRRSSPGARTLAWLPVTNSIMGTLRGFPLRGQSVQTPSSAVVREIIGPAGSDMQIFPPTVASFQILKDARKERQHMRKRGAAVQSDGAFSTNCSSSTTLQEAALFNPFFEAWREGHLSLSRSMSVWVFPCGSEKSHVPPASHAKPFSHFVTASALAGRRTSVIVFKSIDLRGQGNHVCLRRVKLQSCTVFIF